MNTSSIHVGIKDALALLGKTATVHTFSNSFFLAGCDVSRQKLMQCVIDHNGAEILTDKKDRMVYMGHPLKVETEFGPMFVEVDPDLLRQHFPQEK